MNKYLRISLFSLFVFAVNYIICALVVLIGGFENFAPIQLLYIFIELLPLFICLFGGFNNLGCEKFFDLKYTGNSKTIGRVICVIEVIVSFAVFFVMIFTLDETLSSVATTVTCIGHAINNFRIVSKQENF